MLVNIAEIRRDPSRALARIDEDRRALADNYAMLARAVVALAVADFVACRHPASMREYMARWIREEHPYGDARVDALSWRTRQKSELLEFFRNGGGELARAAGCYHYVRLALARHRISQHRLRDVSKRKNKRQRIGGGET
jgi:hypothetical protein